MEVIMEEKADVSVSSWACGIHKEERQHWKDCWSNTFISADVESDPIGQVIDH